MTDPGFCPGSRRTVALGPSWPAVGWTGRERISLVGVDSVEGVRGHRERSHPAPSMRRKHSMSTTTITTPSTAADGTTGGPARLWPTGVVAGAAATAATCLVAAVAHAAGVGLAIEGERIPTNGFATLTIAGALLGLVLAKLFAHRARHPRSAFVRTTVALTVLSIVPDLVVDATSATKAVLAATHVIAAAIIVPALARRLAD